MITKLTNLLNRIQINNLPPGSPSGVPSGSASPPLPPNDVKSVLAYRFDIMDYWMWLAGAALVLLAWFAYSKWIRKRQPKETPKAEPQVDPMVEVLAEIGRLTLPSGFENAGTQRKFYFQATLLFRQFIEYRFQIPATDMTPKELFPVFDKRIPFSAQRVTQMKNSLREIEMVKFSDHMTSEEFANGWINQVQAWVKDLKPATHSQESKSGAGVQGRELTIATSRSARERI